MTGEVKYQQPFLILFVQQFGNPTKQMLQEPLKERDGVDYLLLFFCNKSELICLWVFS